MYLAEMRIRNFRQFGDPGLFVRFNKGVTALVGQNDAGKSSVIDAIRFALLTRDQDVTRVQPDDFHITTGGQVADQIYIQCRLADLSAGEKGAFIEYLTYETSGVALYLTWTARRLPVTPGSRRWLDLAIRTGLNGTGPALDSTARTLLAAAYLRPLRDAEREMSSGRGSRLSQILANVPGIESGKKFDKNSPPTDMAEVRDLSLVGLSEFVADAVEHHPQVRSAQRDINDQYLAPLLLKGDTMVGKVSYAEAGTESARLRQILERLNLGLLDGDSGLGRGRFGLGSNNLLFMAGELLLLGKEPDGLPLLLIEEPEAHLHPQRQLRLMEFLEAAASGSIADSSRGVQVILTTHSPNLASKVPLRNITILEGHLAYSLGTDNTLLSSSDYRFLERFLDVTKANLFFARGVVIAEGDAEALLIPTLAKLLRRDFTEYGVSIVNVGGTGLRRFARIFQRSTPTEPVIPIPVACVTDMDVLPDCAPAIIGLVDDDTDPKWSSSKRRWLAKRDLGTTAEDQELGLKARRAKIMEGDGQSVRTFVADHWTLEYDLAHAGLGEDVYVAAVLAKNDDPLNGKKKQRDEVETQARKAFDALKEKHGHNLEELCAHVYKLYKSEGASKAIAAQYLAEILTDKLSQGEVDANALRQRLPRYLVEAIEYVTPDHHRAPGDHEERGTVIDE